MSFDLAQMVLMVVLGLGQPAGQPASGKDCGCKDGNARIWVSIERDRVSLLRGSEPATCGGERFAKDAFAVCCRELRSEVVSESGRTVVKLVCTDAEFHTGEGMHGQAAQLVYDSSADTLELRGDDKQQVRLWWKSSATDDLHVASRGMQIDLKRSHFRMHGLGDLVPPAPGCCCASGCACAEGGCCSKRAVEILPAAVEPARLRDDDAFERVFNFGGFRFTR